MATTKITKKEMFANILALDEVQSNQGMVDFINHEIELLDKKASNKSATKTQIENLALADVIVDTLTSLGKPVTVTELQSANAELSATLYSNQKISAILRTLHDNGRVTKTMDKRKTYFSV